MRYFEKIKYSFTVVNSVLIFSKCLYLKTLNQSLYSFKKIAIFGLFLFFGFSGFSQVDSLECDKGIEKAIEDSEQGIYNSYSFTESDYIVCGPIIEDDYLDYKIEYAQTNYNINLLVSSSFRLRNLHCYVQKMDSLIKEKYSDSIFDMISRESRENYNLKLLNENDSTYVFEIVDTFPKFVDGLDSLKIFIEKNIKYLPNNFGIVWCSFVVNIDGSLTDFEIMKGVDIDADREVIRLLKTMPNWSPGILNGQKVRTKVVVPIKFTG